MAFNRKNYPPYWKQFSLYIRKERAGDKCEKCGVPNGEIIERGYLNALRKTPIWFDGHGGTYHAQTGQYLGQFHSYDLELERITKICLTVAHLDNTNGVCQCRRVYGFKCAKPSHVLALCQACHLNLDREKHLAVQAKNRAKKKDAERGLLNFV